MKKLLGLGAALFFVSGSAFAGCAVDPIPHGQHHHHKCCDHAKKHGKSCCKHHAHEKCCDHAKKAFATKGTLKQRTNADTAILNAKELHNHAK